MNIPGTTISVDPENIHVDHCVSDAAMQRPFTHKREYLAQYQSDWATWLTETKASWTVTGMCLVDELAAWWKPLLAMAPTLRTAVAGNCLIRTDDELIVIDFAEGDIRAYNNEPIRYRLDIARPLLEGVVRQKAVDWSN